VVDRLVEAVDRNGTPFAGSRVLVLGIAYKKNVDDTRESPSLKLIKLIEQRGAAVDYHDPHVPVIPVTREHASLAGRRSIDLGAEAIASYDAVLIATDHDDVDYRLVASHAKVTVDTRNACARSGVSGDRIVKA
jgi:UDP-N-acetyl-D-glucosamine dehydrogenase